MCDYKVLDTDPSDSDDEIVDSSDANSDANSDADSSDADDEIADSKLCASMPNTEGFSKDSRRKNKMENTLGRIASILTKMKSANIDKTMLKENQQKHLNFDTKNVSEIRGTRSMGQSLRISINKNNI